MQIVHSSKKHIGKNFSKKRLYLFILTIPFIVAVFLFNYLPLFGWIYAFFNYKPGIPLSKTAFVGVEKFIEIFHNSGDVLRVLRNTLVLSFMSILSSPLPVMLAILITEVKNSKFQKLVQTVTTLPNFISWIIIYSLSVSLFSTQGLLNEVLLNLGFIVEPLKILGNNNIVWPFQIGLLIWKTLGWSSIIYLAAIAGIDNELYDAATVDGAGRFRRILHITIPGVSATFIVLLLLQVGALLNAGSSMDQFLVFFNPLVADRIEVLDLYVYRIGLKINDYALATAVGIFKSIISITLLFTVNSASKKIRGQSII